jgi:cold shock CspA family protein
MPSTASASGPPSVSKMPGMPQATVKSYDSITKTGMLVTDDGKTEYPIDEVSMQTSMFRFLRPGQRVTFDLIEEAGEARTRNLRIGII